MHVVFRHLWQKICMASFLVMGPILISLLLCWDACQQVRTGCPLIHAVESHTWTPKKKPGWYVYYIDRSDSYLCRIMVSLRMARRNLQGGRTPLLLERLHTCSHRPQSKCRIAIANCRNNTLVGIAKRLGCLSPFCTWQVLWSDGHFCVRVCVCLCVHACNWQCDISESSTGQNGVKKTCNLFRFSSKAQATHCNSSNNLYLESEDYAQ